MDPGILIPVTGYGGHERLVEMFAKAYLQAGHEVDLLVTTGSHVPGCTVYGIGKAGFPPGQKTMQKALFTSWKFLLKHRKKYDLIHNFGRLLYLLPVLNSKAKKIMTYGREITAGNARLITKLPNKNLVFTGCSRDLIDRSGAKGNWHAVYNAIEFAKYDLKENVPENAPLIFLGRIEKIKGCHTAIDVALKTGNKLIIAGNISPLPEEQQYFEKEIKPFIDGNRIAYVGAVNDSQKNTLLGSAKALLFPIEWNEPFGIVMIEAMACGTPVIAFKRGSVDEVVDDGITGFKVMTKEEMAAAILKIGSIERSGCRRQAEHLFSAETIAAQYLSLL